MIDTDYIELADHHSDDEGRCAAPGCTEREDSQHDELILCEACGSRFCSLCVVKLEDLPFCQQCRVCDTCGDLATSLNGDGDLACAKHGPAEVLQ